MSAAGDLAIQLINNAIANANTLQNKAIGYTDAAQNAAATVLTSIGSVFTPDEVTVEIPSFINQTEDLGNAFKIEYDNKLALFKTDFTTQINTFLNTWFPDFNGQLKSVAENWIVKAINVGGTGIPATVENQIWDRARGREILEGRRQREVTIDAWGARGFAVPQDIQIQQVAMITQDLANKNSTINRDIAIKNIEIEIENVRFAVGKAVELRLGIISALSEFLRTFFTLPDLARSYAAEYIDAKRRLWEAAAAYYNALIGAARLALEYGGIRVDRDLKIAEITVQAITAFVQGRVTAAVGGADAVGKMASAQLGALNNLAHVGEVGDGTT